jgi:hypothetical protein
LDLEQRKEEKKGKARLIGKRSGTRSEKMEGDNLGTAATAAKCFALLALVDWPGRRARLNSLGPKPTSQWESVDDAGPCLCDLERARSPGTRREMSFIPLLSRQFPPSAARTSSCLPTNDFDFVFFGNSCLNSTPHEMDRNYSPAKI